MPCASKQRTLSPPCLMVRILSTVNYTVPLNLDKAQKKSSPACSVQTHTAHSFAHFLIPLRLLLSLGLYAHSLRPLLICLGPLCGVSPQFHSQFDLKLNLPSIISSRYALHSSTTFFSHYSINTARHARHLPPPSPYHPNDPHNFHSANPWQYHPYSVSSPSRHGMATSSRSTERDPIPKRLGKPKCFRHFSVDSKTTPPFVGRLPTGL